MNDPFVIPWISESRIMDSPMTSTNAALRSASHSRATAAESRPGCHGPLEPSGTYHLDQALNETGGGRMACGEGELHGVAAASASWSEYIGAACGIHAEQQGEQAPMRMHRRGWHRSLATDPVLDPAAVAAWNSAKSRRRGVVPTRNHVVGAGTDEASSCSVSG